MLACEYDKAVLRLHSYSIMRKCWEADCRKRPSFSQLQTTFTAMLSSAQNTTYINLHVDEMLPCYSMNTTVEDEECELPCRDFHLSLTVVGGEGGSTDGYQTLKAGDSGLGGYRTLEAGDDASLGEYRTLECEEGANDSTVGYHTLEGGNDDDSTGGYRTLKRGDDSSIANADVAVLDAAGKATVEQHA